MPGQIQIEPLEARCLLAVQLVNTFPSYPLGLTGLGDELFYRLHSSLEPFQAAIELHRTDGTVQGTARVRLPADGSFFIDRTLELAKVENKVFVYSKFGKSDVFLIDNQTNRVTSLLPADVTTALSPSASVGGLLLFPALDEGGIELWRSDGTRGGTFRLADLRPGPEGSIPTSFAVLGNQLFFNAKTLTQHGEVWRTDGRLEGTYVLPGPQNQRHDLTAAGDQVYFSASSGDGIRIWVSDGTVAGTKIIDGQFGDPFFRTAAGGRAFFTAFTAAGPSFLVTDGTSRGTKQLPALNLGNWRGSAFQRNSMLGLDKDLLVSTARPPSIPDDPSATDVNKLWKLDTSNRWTLLHNSGASKMTLFGNKVFFIDQQNQLCVTDGTPAGTFSLGVPASDLAATDTGVFFAHEKQLWKVDLSVGSITGTVWNDRDGNGVRSDLEEGLSGFRAYVDLNRDRRWNPGEPFARTDTDGSYRITGLPAGKHVVRMTSVEGWNYTTDWVRTVSVQPVLGATFDLGLQGNAGAIIGTTYRDDNGNGRRDPGEPGVGGFRVFLDLNNNGRLDSAEPWMRTDVDGRYRFDNLPAGRYIVRATPVDMWIAQPNWQRAVHVAPDQQLGVNFYLQPTIEVRGRVFHDQNNNGIRDSGDAIAANLVYYLYLDLNNDGQHNPQTEPKVHASFSGEFVFRGLAPGTNYLRLASEVYTVTAPANAVHIIVTDSPRVFTDIEFGVVFRLET